MIELLNDELDSERLAKEMQRITNNMPTYLITDIPIFRRILREKFHEIVKRHTHRLRPKILTELEIEQDIHKFAVQQIDKGFLKYYKGEFSIDDLKLKPAKYEPIINIIISRIKHRTSIPFKTVIENPNPRKKVLYPNLFSPRMTMIFAYCGTLTESERGWAKYYLTLIKKAPRCIWNKEEQYIPTCKYLVYHPKFKKLHTIYWKRISEAFLKFLTTLR